MIKSCPFHSNDSRKLGFTILELLVVLVVVAALASLALPLLDSQVEAAERTVARANLNAVREAIIGSSTAPGMVADMRYVPGFATSGFQYREWEMIPMLLDHDDTRLTTREVYPDYDVVTNRGWRGPYLERFPGVQNTDSERLGLFPAGTDRRSADDESFYERGFFYDAIYSHYGQPGYRAIGDQWGNPIVLQIPPDEAFVTPSNEKRWRYARLVSAGPDGRLSTPRYDSSILDIDRRRRDARLAGLQPDGSTELRGDDLVLFLTRPDIYEEEP